MIGTSARRPTHCKHSGLGRGIEPYPRILQVAAGFGLAAGRHPMAVAGGEFEHGIYPGKR